MERNRDVEKYKLNCWLKANSRINMDGCLECAVCGRKIAKYAKIVPVMVKGCVDPSGHIDSDHERCAEYVYLLSN